MDNLTENIPRVLLKVGGLTFRTQVSEPARYMAKIGEDVCMVKAGWWKSIADSANLI